jgi:ribosomal protein L11 methyltransferase
MASDRGLQVRVTFAWRKLSAAKWEDVWWDRLSEFRERLAVSALAGARTIRVEVFALSKVEAARLVRAFGGQVRTMTRAQQLPTVAVRAPIKVRNRLVVVATTEERVGESRPRLVIPAGMAFGTGDHATTATCLRLLADVSDELAGQRWEMLDLGCGTGILALAGRRLGAHRALAGDFDSDSVRTTKENARANQIERVTVRRLDVLRWQPARTWEVVAANLYSRILVEIAPKLAASTAPGGRLIFSGILRAQEGEVVAALRAHGFRIARVVRKGRWVTGLATRALR